MEVYLSSYCSTNRTVGQAVQDIAALGIGRIELTGGCEFASYSEDELSALRREMGLKFVVHNYFPPQQEEFVLNLASEDPHIRERSLKMVSDALELVDRLGGSLYSVHGGYWFEQSVEKDRQGYFFLGKRAARSNQAFYENLRQIAETMIPEGMRLAVENAFPAHGHASFSLLSRPKEIFEFLDFCRPYANLGLLLDLGHLNLAATYLGFDKELFLGELVAEHADKIFELHVSSNDGLCDAHRINSPDSFEIEFLRRHRSKLEHAPVVMEWQQCLGPEVATQFKRMQTILNGQGE